MRSVQEKSLPLRVRFNESILWKQTVLYSAPGGTATLPGPRAGWPPHQSVEESLEVIRTVFCDVTNTWAIELKETGEAIGAMGYGPSCNCNLPARDGEPLIGYWIAKPYWNKGICTEALGLMIEHIRCRTDIKSLISGHFVDNPASGRVMEKCGFVPTGETVIDETQYQGADRPIRVLRLTISK